MPRLERLAVPTSGTLRLGVVLVEFELVPAHGLRSTDAALREPTGVPFPSPSTDEVEVAADRPGGWRVRLRVAGVEDGRLRVEVERTE